MGVICRVGPVAYPQGSQLWLIRKSKGLCSADLFGSPYTPVWFHTCSSRSGGMDGVLGWLSKMGVFMPIFARHHANYPPFRRGHQICNGTPHDLWSTHTFSKQCSFVVMFTAGVTVKVITRPVACDLPTE